jgi:hypothetical protein
MGGRPTPPPAVESRAVGAASVSPAIHRGVCVSKMIPESRRDGASHMHGCPSLAFETWETINQRLRKYASNALTVIQC